MNELRGDALDARLISDAIIELNISRRNVAIYPRSHSSVTRSLDRAYGFLTKLFELKDRISLAAAKDTLIVGDYSLDSGNPVYREFARSLGGLGIASVTFRKGLERDELYAFHSLLADSERQVTVEDRLQVLEEYGLKHVDISPVDYGAFDFGVGKADAGESQKDLWGRYVKGLLDGTLDAAESGEELRKIPPEVLAELLNRSRSGGGEQSYDAVITGYLRKAAQTSFSGRGLQRLLEVIEDLAPELKKEFLASSVKMLSRDISHVEKAMRNVSAEQAAAFLATLSEQGTFMPKSLKAIVERFSQYDRQALKEAAFAHGAVADDFLLSPELTALVLEKRYEEHIPRSYEEELARIMSIDYGARAAAGRESDLGWREEDIEAGYNRMILELVGTELPTSIGGVDAGSFAGSLVEHLQLFAASGQYGQILESLKYFTSRELPGAAAATASEVLRSCGSHEYMTILVDSFRALGRQARDDALALCTYYGRLIVPLLLDALAEEKSQSVRRFLIGLVVHIGEKAIPEVRKRLVDERWYVKRNALFLLGEWGGDSVNDIIRPYCLHYEPRVSAEALRALVRAGDTYGIAVLRENILSPDREKSLRAIALAGLSGCGELTSDLGKVLGKRVLKRRDYEPKHAAVKALAQIGTEEAREILRNLLSVKSIVFAKETEKLRVEARRALDRSGRGGGEGGP